MVRVKMVDCGRGHAKDLFDMRDLERRNDMAGWIYEGVHLCQGAVFGRLRLQRS